MAGMGAFSELPLIDPFVCNFGGCVGARKKYITG